MKLRLKLSAIMLAFASITSNLTVSAEEQRFNSNESEIEIATEKAYSDDDYEKFIEFVGSLIKLGHKSKSVEELLLDTQNIEEVQNISLYRNVESFESDTETSEGKIEDDMIVRVEFGDNAWVEYALFPSTENNEIMSSATANFVRPLDALNMSSHITQEYNSSSHRGIDIAWSGISGTNIRAASAGTVSYRTYQSDFGYIVAIKHTSTLSTAYAHMTDYNSTPAANSTIANGTTFTINDTALYNSYVFGKISSGTHSGRWVALSNGSLKYCKTPNY